MSKQEEAKNGEQASNKQFLNGLARYERLATSSFHNLTERLNFNFRRYIVQMSIENGIFAEIQRLETGETCLIGLNPVVFAQLLLGHRNRHELEMNYPDFHVQDDHKQLVDVLFPKLPSYIHDVY
jgi:hypothetical protein